MEQRTIILIILGSLTCIFTGITILFFGMYSVEKRLRKIEEILKKEFAREWDMYEH